MSVRISDDAMVSDAMRHTARRVPGGWALSWLPGRVFDRYQAVSGMTAAEVLARRPAPDDPVWLHVRGWLAELGISEAEWPCGSEHEPFRTDAEGGLDRG